VGVYLVYLAFSTLQCTASAAPSCVFGLYAVSQEMLHTLVTIIDMLSPAYPVLVNRVSNADSVSFLKKLWNLGLVSA